MNISRPNVYKVIEGLEKHGLASFSNKRGYSKRFMVLSPSRVIELFHQKQKQMTTIERQFTYILPELMQQYSQGTLPTQIQVIHNREHLRQTMEQVFAEVHDELIAMGSSDDLNSLFQYADMHKFIKQRIKRGIRTRLLSFPGKYAQEFKKNDKKELRETRIITSEYEEFTTTFYVFGNKTIIWQPLTPSAVFIEDEYITDMFKSLFERAWRDTQ